MDSALEIRGTVGRLEKGLTRRSFLRMGLAGAGVVLAAACAPSPAAAPTQAPAPAKLPAAAPTAAPAAPAAPAAAPTAAVAAPAAAPAVKGPVTLQAVFTFTTEEQRKALEEVFAAYEKATPSTQVKTQAVPEAKIEEIMQTRLAANDPPDIALMPTSRVLTYGTAGRLADLTQLVPADLKAKFDKTLIKHLQFNNQLVGLPFHLGEFATAVNMDAINAAGIKVPGATEGCPMAMTWDELTAAAQNLQKSGKTRWGLVFRNSADSMIQYVYQNGGALVTPDGKKPAINQPPAVEAIQWIVDLHKKGIAAPGVIAGSEDPTPLFASGQVPFFLSSGSFMVSAFETNVKTFKYGFTFMPRKVKSTGLVGGSGIVAFKAKVPQVEETWKLMQFVVQPDNMVKVTDAMGTFPTRSDASPKNYPRQDLVPFFRNATTCQDEALFLDTSQAYWGNNRDTFLRELGDAINGQKTAQQAADAMAVGIAKQLTP